MPAPKRVLCIMDLSLAGRAGLAVVLPVLAACGVQACPMPTSLYSTHTGGFGAIAKEDASAFCLDALAHFAREGIAFDAVYTGYLNGEEQFALAEKAFAQYPGALHLADPAMGDNGRLYTGLGPDTVAHMQKLCAGADIITPNYTESALLCGEDPALPCDDALLTRRLDRLGQGSTSVLITSVPQNEGFATVGRAAGEAESFSIASHRVPAHYPGTGDTLAAAICGLSLQENAPTLQKIVQKASSFVEAAASHTHAQGGEPRHGLWLEPFLCRLAPHPGEPPQ